VYVYVYVYVHVYVYVYVHVYVYVYVYAHICQKHAGQCHSITRLINHLEMWHSSYSGEQH